MTTPSKDVPYSVTAESLGLEHEHVPLVEQERRKQYNHRFGLGDPNQFFWGWLALALGSAAGALVGFL